MRIECDHHVLQDDRLAVLGCDEYDLPGHCRAGEFFGVEVGVQRVEVALGESDVELRDPVLVREPTAIVDGISDGQRDALVYDGKVTYLAFGLDSPGDDLIDVGQHIVDGLSLWETAQ